MNQLLKLTLSAFLSIVFIATAHASGSGGGGGGFGGGSYNSSAPRKQIDESYEYGKAIFTGRLAGATKYNYCIDVDGEKLPIKRKHFKQYKKGTYLALANGLYDCERPEKLIGLEVSQDSFQYVLYYLNKRYKLKLSGLNDA